ncbi:tyrosine-type recombinase/integrase [Microbacterium aurugineum]|uniref:tyrosine-type recombinase/integrase n=1 Tax=Microbacterium aurugineum TaxID=2851642 RepID=UPI0020BE99D4|nr:site-specific integrase [Microbacterium aurugineum]MCK8476470.1 site-specific integrase [Microbacterium aurugineum]
MTTPTAVVARHVNRDLPGRPTRRPSSAVDFDALLREHHSDESWPETEASVDELARRGGDLVVGLSNQNTRVPGLRRVLDRLAHHPGDTWQERWLNSGQENDYKQRLDVSGDKQSNTHGLHLLLVLGAVRPSYGWLKANQFKTWHHILQLRDPGGYACLERAFEALGRSLYDNRAASVVLAHVSCRTGKTVSEITGDDLLAYQYAMKSFRLRGVKVKVAGIHHAWDCLKHMGTIDHDADTLRLAQLQGQRTPTELVDQHQIESDHIREGLVRYLRAREGRLDYSSLRSLSANLCGLFWSDVEKHNPGIDTLSLSEDAAADWRRRLAVKADGTERRSRFNVMMQVRAMYLDIATWALSDASWLPWVAPAPVTDADVAGNGKAQKEAKARSHQRTRERAPEVDRLLQATEARLRSTTSALAAAAELAKGDELERDGLRYRRIGSSRVMLRPAGAVDQKSDIDLSSEEDEAFWAWATVHLLHQTGLRIEELVELDQFSIQRFKHPKTGEIIPLLHVYPSKSSSERLLAASPELVHVLARIVHRLRQPDGSLPLTVRWDTQEKRTQPAAPLLFQRYRARWKAMSYQYIYGLMDKAGEWARLSRSNGEPLKFRPHDMRRIFATDAQSSGVPIHVIAALLGHESIETTGIYAATYPEEVIRAHNNFIAHRRASSPQPEQREITDEEWNEFQQHFVERKLSLGTCGRAWGASCEHEHACVRCSLLRPDPAALERFIEIRDNISERIEEAREKGWLGEVEGLEVTLFAAEDKIRRMTQLAAEPSGPTQLGMPSVRPNAG